MVGRAEKGKQASVNGFAHEHVALGILMKKYQNVSLVDLPHSPYDIIIVRKNIDGSEETIRAQVKTATKAISFRGGSRGGVDRTYKSGVKEYTQNTKLSDIIVGVGPRNGQSFDLYFVPTILVERMKKQSLSLKRAASLKNNYEMLERCKDESFILQKAREYGLLE